MAVFELKPRPLQVHESVVVRLEEVLERAREGKVVSVAIATLNADGSVGSAWSETDDFGKLLGSVCRLEHRINTEQSTS